ncbi:nucleotidyl transferase AbiEii/AbiGii toxin family protein [Treponema rectale]|uniref:Nucleotidyl transferase AbiEii/AbiGii toxin family protein n=1 Tax=Treponema rectale TaxID=744512 RepID=A0A7M1XKK7_9SPIR|nr:nucleotidyl transferase AbiEii/AbiGii toxin family protein [Treponema rectale]
MNSIIDEMLKKYKAETLDEKKNAIKEIIQEIVLCGLSRAGFFDKAAFYGGTALRIFYGLDRFSEDLDFSLKEKDVDFDLTSYFPVLEKEVRAFGLNLKVEEKHKNTDSDIKSAFLKGNTKEHLLLFYANDDFSFGVNRDEILRIKFEVDTNPPGGARYEHRYSLKPAPYEVTLYDLPSLFAGKVHAVLCRGWKNRVKGRDLYDFVFYLQRGVSLNLENLKQKLIQSEAWKEDDELSLEEVKRMLCERFDHIDFEKAKDDVRDFIKDKASLNIWSSGFFKAITGSLKKSN